MLTGIARLQSALSLPRPVIIVRAGPTRHFEIPVPKDIPTPNTRCVIDQDAYIVRGARIGKMRQGRDIRPECHVCRRA